MSSRFESAGRAWIANNPVDCWAKLTALAQQVKADIAEDGDNVLGLTQGEVMEAHAYVRWGRRSLEAYTLAYVQNPASALAGGPQMLVMAVRLALLLAVIGCCCNTPTRDVPADLRRRCEEGLEAAEVRIEPYEGLRDVMRKTLEKSRVRQEDVDLFFEEVMDAGEAIQDAYGNLFDVFVR